MFDNARERSERAASLAARTLPQTRYPHDRSNQPERRMSWETLPSLSREAGKISNREGACFPTHSPSTTPTPQPAREEKPNQIR